MIGVGFELKGYCGGIFGRDVDWGSKRIEALGNDWIVARDKQGYPWFANFDSNEQMQSRLAEALEGMRQGKENGEWWAD